MTADKAKEQATRDAPYITAFNDKINCRGGGGGILPDVIMLCVIRWKHLKVKI